MNGEAEVENRRVKIAKLASQAEMSLQPQSQRLADTTKRDVRLIPGAKLELWSGFVAKTSKRTATTTKTTTTTQQQQQQQQEGTTRDASLTTQPSYNCSWDRFDKSVQPKTGEYHANASWFPRSVMNKTDSGEDCTVHCTFYNAPRRKITSTVFRSNTNNNTNHKNNNKKQNQQQQQKPGGAGKRPKYG